MSLKIKSENVATTSSSNVGEVTKDDQTDNGKIKILMDFSFLLYNKL